MGEKFVNPTEQAILAAAEREFMQKGFAGARTVSIAQAANVTHAMLHYYFRTKEHLFNRIIDDKIRLLGELFLRAFGRRGLPLDERLREGIASHFDLIAANPDLPRFIVNEVFSFPERFETMRLRLGNIATLLANDMQREVDEAARRGEMEAVDVRMLMLDIVSLNVFSFLAYPLIEPILGDLTADRERFFALRKAENIELIMRRIRKQTP